MKRVFAVLALLASASLDTGAQPSVGHEVRVNGVTRNDRVADVAIDAQGNFVVVWQSEETRFTVHGRRFDSSGQPLGDPFVVVYPGASPRVAMDADGDFVVAWSLAAHRFDSRGNPQGTFLDVNGYDASYGHAVAMNGRGEFVVTWADYYGHVSLQRFNAAGDRVGPYRGVRSRGYTPDLAMNEHGDLVLVWSSSDPVDGSVDIVGQRFDRDGEDAGREFRMQRRDLLAQRSPAVAIDGKGSFVVAWQSVGPDRHEARLSAQLHDRRGQRVGPEFHADLSTVRWNGLDVAFGAAGGYLVVWSDGAGVNGEIVAQRFSSGGAGVGSQFRVNTTTAGDQANPAAAGNGRGDVVLTWDSTSQDGSTSDVFAQRYRIRGRGATVTVTATASPTRRTTVPRSPTPTRPTPGRMASAMPASPPTWSYPRARVWATVRRSAADRRSEKGLMAGHRLVVEELVSIGRGVRIGDDVEIGFAARIEGGVDIGDGVTIGDRVAIKRNVVIEAGAAIHPLAVLLVGARVGAGATVEMGAQIGRRAIVRAGAVVPAGTTVPPERDVPVVSAVSRLGRRG